MRKTYTTTFATVSAAALAVTLLTGKIVPATQVPKSARSVSGYKPPSAKVAQPPKVDLKKPGNAAPPRPAAPAPRPAGRR